MQFVLLPRTTFPRRFERKSRRRGYTLIEMLVVITILVIVLAMTVLAVNFSRDGDRVTGAAGQIQSYLGGARDRAIYAKSPRGVRFFLDPNNPRAVSSMVYIDPATTWSDGVIQLRRWDPDFDGLTDARTNSLDINQDGITFDSEDGIAGDNPTKIWMVTGAGTAWWELKRRGLLFDGMVITIPKGSRNFYPINTRLIDITVPPTELQTLVLGIPYRDPGDTPKPKSLAFESGGPEDYEIHLPPRILPIEPVILPQGTVIDLDSSKLPPAWRPFVSATTQSSGNSLYSQYIDLVYSQRGNLIGDASSGGVIHFYVCDNEDSLLIKEEYIASLDPVPATALAIFNNQIRSGVFIPSDEIDSTTAPWAANIAPASKPFLVKDRRIVSIFAQTGAVSVHPVDPTDLDTNGFADDPFYFAETGESAK